MEHLLDHAPGAANATGRLGHTDRLRVGDIARGEIHTEAVAKRVRHRANIARLAGKRSCAYMAIVIFIIGIAASGGNSADFLEIIGAVNIGPLDRITFDSSL